MFINIIGRGIKMSKDLFLIPCVSYYDFQSLILDRDRIIRESRGRLNEQWRAKTDRINVSFQYSSRGRFIELYIKRDDCFVLAGGKMREIEEVFIRQVYFELLRKANKLSLGLRINASG